MSTHSETDSSSTDIIEITHGQLQGALDREARDQLGVSGEEFTRRWMAGEYRDDDNPQVTAVAMLLPGDAW